MPINLSDYRKIASSVKKNKVSVQDQEVKAAFSWLQSSRAKFSLKLGSCQKGDWVEIGYQSLQIDPLVKNSIPGIEKEKKDAFILGKGHLIPGFEGELEGMQEGQEKEITLVFPENHFLKDLAGKKVDFQVKMKSVQKIELPEINDQFAQSLGRFGNLETLEKSLKEELYLEKEAEESQRVRQEILEKITQSSEIEIPEVLVAREQNLMMEILQQEIPQKLGISFADYLAKIKLSEKELFESFLTEAKARVKKPLILKEISERENIEVSEDEVKETINKNIKYLAPQRVKELDPERLKEYTKDVIRNEKTLARLESFARES